MTFENFEKAKEVYAKWDWITSLACSFNKGEFNETKDIKIQILNDDDSPSHTLIIPDEIRQKINDLLWEESHKIQKEFEAI